MNLETDVVTQLNSQKQAILDAENDPESFKSLLQYVRNTCTIENDIREKGIMDIQHLVGLSEEDANTIERMDTTCAVHIYVKPLENMVYGSLRVGTIEGRILTSARILDDNDIHAAIAAVCNILLRPVILKKLPWLDFYFNRDMDIGFIDKVLTGTSQYTEYNNLNDSLHALVESGTNIVLHNYVPDDEWDNIYSRLQGEGVPESAIVVAPAKLTPKGVLKLKLQGEHLIRRRALALYKNIKPVNSELIDGECYCIYHDWLRMELPMEVDTALHNIHMQHQVYDLEAATHTCTNCGCKGNIKVEVFKCNSCGYTKKFIDEEWAEDIYCGICPNCGDGSGFVSGR